MKKIVSNQLSPNLTLFDALHAGFQLPLLFCKKNRDFSSYFGSNNSLLLNGARSGLGILASILPLDKTKRIGIPAFSCAVMSTPFLARGYQIEWIDTDENGVISFEDFEKKSGNLALVLVPHTFGFPAPIEKIYALAKQKNIFVIEDCAHRFTVGTEYCDAKIYSFGREKIFSCVSGGALVWKPGLVNEDQLFSYPLSEMKKTDTIRLILHPFFFSLALPFWFFGYLGKAFIFVLAKLRIIPRAVTEVEKNGKEDFPIARLCRPLQNVLSRQLKKQEKQRLHREMIATQWKDILSELFPRAQIIVPDNYFRVFLKTDEATHILEESKNIGFDFREWDGCPIAPKSVNLSSFFYAPGYCPHAEAFSQNYVSFPTNKRTTVSDVVRFYSLWKLLQS